LQGGPKNTMITENDFSSNGRWGLALTGFGGDGDSSRGAQDNSISNNCFTANGFTNNGGGIFFSSSQYPGTIATNTLNQNNISDNAVGALYSGTETIDAENNWWDAVDGPSGDGTGSGDAVDGMSGGGTIDFEPFLITIAENTPCSPEPTCAELFPCGRNGNKVEICHIPLGNPENAHTICINPNATDEHFELHGDFCGPCETN